MNGHYILEDRKVIETDLMTWARFLECFDKRRVAEHRFNGVQVSTVFIGLDHSFGHGPPLVFETMVFGGAYDGYQERCSTYEEAEAIHAKAVSMVKLWAWVPAESQDLFVEAWEAAKKAFKYLLQVIGLSK